MLLSVKTVFEQSSPPPSRQEVHLTRVFPVSSPVDHIAVISLVVLIQFFVHLSSTYMNLLPRFSIFPLLGLPTG